MPVKEKAKHILVELKGHLPFTFFGALLGIIFVLLFRNFGRVSSHTLFAVFHPAHVILSAMVTASMFKLHAAKKRFILVLIVGYFGSIGVATVSDIIIPHIGLNFMGLNIPAHAQLHRYETVSTETHEHVHSGQTEHQEHRIYLGFIGEWYIVSLAALLGVFIAYFLPRTKSPHAGHVLVSTWASSSYLLMNMQSEMTVVAVSGIFVTLFIATWLPCCVSDIVFPLLFVKSDIKLAAPCPVHDRHSHAHIHKQSEQNQ